MTLREHILRVVADFGIRSVRWAFSALAVGLVLAVRDSIRRRLWPPREDPERRAQAEAWAALMAEAEEHTRERRPRDPHVLTLDETPHAPDAPPSADTPIRIP
jgi:hypothetical protein